MNNDTASQDKLSVRELRQWLMTLSEKHQDHYRHGQLSKDSIDTQQSTDFPNKEFEEYYVPEPSHSDYTHQQDLNVPRNEEFEKDGSATKRNVVAYSKEDYNRAFRTADQKERHSPSQNKISNKSDTMVSSHSRSTDRPTQTKRYNRQDAFPFENMLWKSGLDCSDQRDIEKETKQRLESDRKIHKTITLLDRLSLDGTVKSNESTFIENNNTTLPIHDMEGTDQILHAKVHEIRKPVEHVVGSTSIVQERQRALQEKWAQDRQLVHKKKVQWRALKGSYKKKITLSVEKDI